MPKMTNERIFCDTLMALFEKSKDDNVHPMTRTYRFKKVEAFAEQDKEMMNKYFNFNPKAHFIKDRLSIIETPEDDTHCLYLVYDHGFAPTDDILNDREYWAFKIGCTAVGEERYSAYKTHRANMRVVAKKAISPHNMIETDALAQKALQDISITTCDGTREWFEVTKEMAEKILLQGENAIEYILSNYNKPLT